MSLLVGLFVLLFNTSIYITLFSGLHSKLIDGFPMLGYIFVGIFETLIVSIVGYSMYYVSKKKDEWWLGKYLTIAGIMFGITEIIYKDINVFSLTPFIILCLHTAYMLLLFRLNTFFLIKNSYIVSLLKAFTIVALLHAFYDYFIYIFSGIKPIIPLFTLFVFIFLLLFIISNIVEIRENLSNNGI